MLPPSHNRAYQELLTLLTKFDGTLNSEKQKIDQLQVKLEFQNLSEWFKQNMLDLNQADLEIAIATRWQSLQTEIKREFKLLSTGILFLASARQNVTQTNRITKVREHIAKLINYCQIMLKDSN